MSAIPPYVIDLRVKSEEHRPFRLWLPLFLLWPLGLALLALALVFTILADVVLLLMGERYHHYSRFLLRSVGLLGELRGTTVYVQNGSQNLVDLTIR